ncbi:MAG: dodecin family protein [Bacteroidetes bacterium]|nr:dodecin family protein [Bacteroidota bacterium]MCZ6694677.1 dodecin family protein [Bacteroidota bacterium]MCZ6901060.1 dodecin family protein [Bacteroidota bacterium]
MSENVYKTIELTGASTAGIEDAIQNAIAKASKTIHNMRWFQIIETRGSIEGDKVGKWQVTMKLGFTLNG